jgi:hypothetical protein
MNAARRVGGGMTVPSAKTEMTWTPGWAPPTSSRVTDQAIGSLLRRADSLPLVGEPVRHIHPTLRGLERPPVTVALA